MAFPFGVMQREDTIEAMESAPAWERYEIRDPHVIALTPNSGIVLYSVTAQRAGQDPHRDDQQHVRPPRRVLEVAFHQQTPA